MPKKILIVDDNQDILEIVQETLTYEQFEVMATSNGADVIALAEEFNPDLVILDYRLGNITGGEICRNLKNMPRFENLPVIIFTAYVNKSEELFAYGCDDTIDKPFDLSELIYKVNNLVNAQ
ncbi:response regulator [Mucilaginibacter sp. RS28]|uniref:Response regulator n=1 Tax=Mucilaginibacter straminoryzae TaxID=2932774 RepID=A0A9X1X3C1_9SPHI|nr:response regulator [Mucilaginibacter straminoryzae]MCJ8210278.1 response regulator [Mucilaginibacter straminoryzae]